MHHPAEHVAIGLASSMTVMAVPDEVLGILGKFLSAVVISVVATFISRWINRRLDKKP